MPLLLIGEEREATTWKSEVYKEAVRRYLESTGYAQTTDSFVDGTIEDMVFVPVGRLGLPDAHVESKDTELSLGDPQLRNEILHHLRIWLSRPQSGRFDFYLFARRLKNPARWKELFEKTSAEAIRSFLTEGDKPIDRELLDLLYAHWQEVQTFFSRAFVVQGNHSALLLAAEKKEETALGSTSRWADELRRRMDRRLAVDAVSDTLVSNVVKLSFPTPFALLNVKQDYFEEIVDTLGIEETPPGWMPSKKLLLTFNDERVLEPLSQFRTGELRVVAYPAVRLDHPNGLISLIHQYVGKIAIAKGAVFEQGEFYFPLKFSDVGPESFTVPGVKDRGVSLAEPLFRPSSHLNEATLVQTTGSRQLNFAHHTGFRFRVETLWGSVFLSFVHHRVYTTDGMHRMHPKSVERVDRHFRDPQFNRSTAQLTKLQAVVDYLFCKPNLWTRRPPNWYGVIRFDYPNPPPRTLDEVARPLLRVSTRWTPVPDFAGEPTLEEYAPPDVDES